MNNRINQFILLLGLLFITICSIRTISSPEFWSHLAQASYGFKLSWIQSEISSHITYLYDHILMFFWKNGGVTLISILNIIGILTSFYLLIRISSKYGNILSNSIALIISGHLVFHSLEIGPGTIMLLFITLSTYAFVFIRNKKILYTALIIIQIIWANLHHSFLFGPLLIFVGLIHLIKSPSRKSTIYPKDIAPLIPILFLISLINPNGLAIYTQTYSSLISPNPIYWFSISNDFFSVASVKPIILFVTVLCGLGLITHKKELPVYHLFLAIFGVALLWTSPKMSIQFVALAYPFMVLSTQSICDYGIKLFKLNLKTKQFTLISQILIIVLLVISIIPVVNNDKYIKNGSFSTFGIGINDDLYPKGLDRLITHPKFPERFINQPVDGGFISFNYNKPCFIDYRSGIYDQSLITDLKLLLLGDEDAFDSVYAKYKPEAFILNTAYPSTDKGILTLLKRDFRLMYFDGNTVVMILNRPKFDDLFNLTDIQQLGLNKLEADKNRFVENPYENGNPPSLIGAGKIYLSLNRPHEAEYIFNIIINEKYRSPGSLIGLANSQLMLNKFEDSYKTSLEVINSYPNNISGWVAYKNACKLTQREDGEQLAAERVNALSSVFKESSDN